MKRYVVGANRYGELRWVAKDRMAGFERQLPAMGDEVFAELRSGRWALFVVQDVMGTAQAFEATVKPWRYLD